MQFEVNGQGYILDFIDEEGRWLLFKPTDDGIAIMPVVDDDARMPLMDEGELYVHHDAEVVN